MLFLTPAGMLLTVHSAHFSAALFWVQEVASDPASVSTTEEMVSLSSPPKTHTEHATCFLTILRGLTPLIPRLTRLQH